MLRFGFERYEHMPHMATLHLGPVGKIMAHLHIRPNEKTDKGAFECRGSVSISAEIFNKHYRWMDLLTAKEIWGLCIRLDDIRARKDKDAK